MQTTILIDSFIRANRVFNSYYLTNLSASTLEVPLEKYINEDWQVIQTIELAVLETQMINLTSDGVYRVVIDKGEEYELEEGEQQIDYIYIRYFVNATKRFLTFVEQILCGKCNCGCGCNDNNKCLSTEAKNCLKYKELLVLSDYVFYNKLGLRLNKETDSFSSIILAIQTLNQKYVHLFQSNLHNPNIDLKSEIDLKSFKIQLALKYLILYQVDYSSTINFVNSGIDIEVVKEEVKAFYNIIKIRSCIKTLGLNIDSILDDIIYAIENPDWNCIYPPCPIDTINYPPNRATNFNLVDKKVSGYYISEAISLAAILSEYNDPEGDALYAIKFVSVTNTGVNLKVVVNSEALIDGGTIIGTGIVTAADLAVHSILIYGEVTTEPIPADATIIIYQVIDIGSMTGGAIGKINLDYPSI